MDILDTEDKNAVKDHMIHPHLIASRMIWMFILLAGVLFAMLGFKPVEAILFAQVANGILLPVIAVYLLVVMNSRKIMGDNVNTLLSNILGGIVVLTAMGLGLRSILHVIGII
jgi:Mn2+/Fe2+ NRAMP family transporter